LEGEIMSGLLRPIEELNEAEIARYVDLSRQRERFGYPPTAPGAPPYSLEDLLTQQNIREEIRRLNPQEINRAYGPAEQNLPGSLAVPPAPGVFTPGVGIPQPPLPPVEERAVRPLPTIAPQPEPQQQPAALLPGPQAAVTAPVQQPVAVPGPQAGPAARASSRFDFGSGDTLLGLAALTDAFAILGGRQPTMLAQMAPIAQQRSQRQAVDRIIDQRMQGNLTPQQATLLGNAVQQAVTGAQTQAAPAGGEVPVLRAAPGQDPNEVRGVRTNNPLNLSFANQPNAIGTDGRFAVFQTPEEGVAASVRQLQLYGQRGLNTIDQIVSRWAPPSENNTPAYIQAVAQRVGVSPNQEIDLSDPNIMRRLVNAMSVQEVGRVIPEDVLQRGVELGYQPPQQRQQPSLTPAQAQITAPSPAVPGGTPGMSMRPRGVPMTPELAATLRELPPPEALKLLAQLDIQASQQRGARALSNTEAQAYFASLGSPQLYDPNKVYQVTQDGGISVVPGTRESEEPTPRQLREDAGKLRTEFGAQKPVQEFLQMGPQILAIRDGVSRENPSRINDISLTFAFAKMLDPTSVVRENEAGQIVASASVADRLAGYIARLNGNATFSPELRAQLLRESEGRYSSARTAYLGEVDAYTELARRKGVNPEFVIPPRRDLPEARPIPGSQQAQTNAVPEAQRPAVVAELTNRIQSGALTQQAARDLARQLGIPNAERLFQ
jgi:hypothetical protein